MDVESLAVLKTHHCSVSKLLRSLIVSCPLDTAYIEPTEPLYTTGICSIKNITFDFIFIDGLHTYEQLTKDCHNYYSILKHEGIFSGHDYNAIAEVRKAVNEFAELKHKQISFTNWDVWYWLK